MANGNGVDAAPPWEFKPILGPLTPSDILAIAGASLAPMHVGYYKPFLPLGLAGQVLLGKEEQYRQQALEQQQREPIAQAIGPLWQARYGTAAPPEVTQAVRESPAGAKFVEPFLEPVQPVKGSYTAAEQAAWGAEVEALPEGTIPPEFKQALKTMGPIQGKSALRAMAPNYIPATPAVQEQRMQTRVEPVQVRIGGQKEVAGLQHEYKTEEIGQQAEAKAEAERTKRETTGFVEKAKKDAELAAEYDKQRTSLDRSLAQTQQLRDLAAKVTTNPLLGNTFTATVRSLFGDADIALFDQYVKQAALPSIKPLLGGANISDADRVAVMQMFAGKTIPTAANLKSLDSVLRALEADKRAMAAGSNYFAQLGRFGTFGQEMQIPKSAEAPKGDKARYIGTTIVNGKPGYKVYENFETGKRYVNTPEGQWGDWLDPNPLPVLQHEMKGL